MTPLSRRAAIRAAVSAVVAISVPSAAVRAQPAPELRTLEAVLDVLLPADGLTPSAAELGVAEELVAVAEPDPYWMALLGGGTRWLNESGPAPFHDLPHEDQAGVLRWMAESDPALDTRTFYLLVRTLALEIYYAHPATLAGLPLNAAPQPEGYPPPWT